MGSNDVSGRHKPTLAAHQNARQTAWETVLQGCCRIQKEMLLFYFVVTVAFVNF